MNIGSTIHLRRWSQALLIFIMTLFAIYYLVPLYVMLANSVKHLAEIRQGNMMSLPKQFSLEYWHKAWNSAQIGVNPTGLKPFFWNSIKMVVPCCSYLNNSWGLERLCAIQMANPQCQTPAWPYSLWCIYSLSDCSYTDGPRTGNSEISRYHRGTCLSTCNLRDFIYHIVLLQCLCNPPQRTYSIGQSRWCPFFSNILENNFSQFCRCHYGYRNMAIHQYME